MSDELSKYINRGERISIEVKRCDGPVCYGRFRMPCNEGHEQVR